MQDSWMDLLPSYTRESREFVLDFSELLRQNPYADEEEAFREWAGREGRRRANQFPINDNLFCSHGYRAGRLERAAA